MTGRRSEIVKAFGAVQAEMRRRLGLVPAPEPVAVA